MTEQLCDVPQRCSGLAQAARIPVPLIMPVKFLMAATRTAGANQIFGQVNGSPLKLRTTLPVPSPRERNTRRAGWRHRSIERQPARRSLFSEWSPCVLEGQHFPKQGLRTWSRGAGQYLGRSRAPLHGRPKPDWSGLLLIHESSSGGFLFDFLFRSVHDGNSPTAGQPLSTGQAPYSALRLIIPSATEEMTISEVLTLAEPFTS